jgi:hypothetical protein
MIQEHVFTEAQARSRGITLDSIIAPYLLDGYKVIYRDKELVRIQRYVSARQVRY